MKPLVVHIRATNFFGGPERQIVGHILASSAFRNMVLTFKEGDAVNDFAKICDEKGIPVRQIASNSAYSLAVLDDLRNIFREEKPLVVCCHGYKPLLLSLFSRGKLGFPIVAFSRGHTSENLKIKLFEFLERKAYCFAEKVVAVSAGYAEWLREMGVDEKKIHVVLNAIDIEKFKPFIQEKGETRKEFGFASDAFLIATAGRLSPEKAQEDLIIAFGDVQKKFPESYLLLFGDGPLRQHLEHIVEKKRISHVRFMGHRTDLDRIMPMLDLFVLPSFTEGLPNVLLEAAACYVPLVATRVGGVPEIITDGKSGLLAAPGDTRQLTELITMCLDNQPLRDAMAREVHEKVKKDFGFARQACLLESIYTALGSASMHQY